MKEQPDFINSELVQDETSPGAICMYGNCYPANFFTEDQWETVHELVANVITNGEFYHKKEIKLLRAKHRKAIKKLKSGIAHLELKLNLCESLYGGEKRPETIMS